MIEVEENVDDLKGLCEGVGHGVPFTVESELCSGKLRIVVTCTGMSIGSLDLNVSVSIELVALKVGELISVIGLYGTLCLVIEGNGGSLTNNVKSELSELLSLSAVPSVGSGNVECLNVLAVLISNYVYGSTALCVNSGALVALLELRIYDSGKKLISNFFLSYFILVDGLFGRNNLVHTAESVTECNVIKVVTCALTLGVTVEVERTDLVGVDEHTVGKVANVLTVDVIINRHHIAVRKLDENYNVKPTGPLATLGESKSGESGTVETCDINGSLAIRGNGHDFKDTN